MTPMQALQFINKLTDWLTDYYKSFIPKCLYHFRLMTINNANEQHPNQTKKTQYITPKRFQRFKAFIIAHIMVCNACWKYCLFCSPPLLNPYTMNIQSFQFHFHIDFVWFFFISLGSLFLLVRWILYAIMISAVTLRSMPVRPH